MPGLKSGIATFNLAFLRKNYNDPTKTRALRRLQLRFADERHSDRSAD